MGEVVETIPSILNKCLFVSPDRRTHGQAETNMLFPFFEVGGIKSGRSRESMLQRMRLWNELT